MSSKVLSAYDFYIQYRPGQLNPTDTPSRRSDYAIVDGKKILGWRTLELQGSATEATVHSIKAGDRVLESQVEAGTKDHELLMPCLAAICLAEDEAVYKLSIKQLLDFIKELQERDTSTAS
ncbi:hypothetical protein PAAG_07456 [Paracoccidioides lutzii Pb01]|uniref:Uncharacterized protein n=1 Tax=Paracoccidioides lutzii (strain ATCC MYA-826 / Pb01) TaxID=502779 RepID=C1H9L5_PARBA|nr:hypothetical protein PAAG_07456 [Paracoccidioides lutzii Pb01]EEH37038.1 hypothetical protein PAAG_07456 [Paracoccidioides lutzii Pb01]